MSWRLNVWRSGEYPLFRSDGKTKFQDSKCIGDKRRARDAGRKRRTKVRGACIHWSWSKAIARVNEWMPLFGT